MEGLAGQAGLAGLVAGLAGPTGASHRPAARTIKLRRRAVLRDVSVQNYFQFVPSREGVAEEVAPPQGAGEACC